MHSGTDLQHGISFCQPVTATQCACRLHIVTDSKEVAAGGRQIGLQRRRQGCLSGVRTMWWLILGDDPALCPAPVEAPFHQHCMHALLSIGLEAQSQLCVSTPESGSRDAQSTGKYQAVCHNKQVMVPLKVVLCYGRVSSLQPAARFCPMLASLYLACRCAICGSQVQAPPAKLDHTLLN